MGILRILIEANVKLSQWFDCLLAEDYRIDGHSHFRDSFAPRFLRVGQRVCDVGGGKTPFVTTDLKERLDLTITALDIDPVEIGLAPPDIYDDAVCADICSYVGKSNADVVICSALLEHVKDVDGAFRAIASILRPDGRALIFVPSRNALFARLNLLLPQQLKRRLLYSIYPQTCQRQGFPVYYDRCTPRDFVALAAKHGLIIDSAKHYFISKYLYFFFPAHVLWRLWLFGFHAIAGEQAAESFSMALRKPAAV